MKTLRILLIILEGFLALTAFAGGIGLLANLNAPPVEMLAGSPFRSYTIPGLALLVIVGGCALFALLWVIKRHPYAALAAAFSGFVIVFFEIVEVMVIGSDPGVARALQIFYTALGLLIILVAAAYWAAGRRAENALKKSASGG